MGEGGWGGSTPHVRFPFHCSHTHTRTDTSSFTTEAIETDGSLYTPPTSRRRKIGLRLPLGGVRGVQNRPSECINKREKALMH